MDDDVRRRAASIRLLALDVDGVLTDGGMYYGASGEELKKFNTRDAQGVALWQAAGGLVAIVTREDTPIVARRAAKMQVAEVHQGVRDKLGCMRDVAVRAGVGLD